MDIKDLKSQMLESCDPYSLYITDENSGEGELISFLKGVTSCSSIVVRMPKLRKIPDAFQHIEKLKSLNVDCSGITEIPGDIFPPNLEHFTFKSQTLEKIPNVIWTGVITTLSISTETLINQEFETLSSINDISKSITLEINNLRVLPHFFVSLRLNSLRVQSQALTAIDHALLVNSQLESFRANSTLLKDIPDLHNHRTLRYIEVTSGKPLDLSSWKLPPSVERMALASPSLQLPNLAQLTNITYLNLEGVQGEVTDAIGKCKSLEGLRFYDSHLTHISEVIAECKNLRELTIISSVSELPKSILNISSLHTLRLRDNNIASINEDWSGLQNLKELVFSNNSIDITSLDFVNDLPKLDYLDLDGNTLVNRYALINRKKIPLRYSGNLLSRCKAPQDEIVAFGAALGKLSYSQQDLQGFFDCFWETGEILTYATANDERIKQALNMAYVPLKIQMHKYFEDEFLKKHSGLSSLGKDAIVYVVGKTVEPLTKIKETIQSIGSTYSSVLSDQVSHIIVGKNPERSEVFNRNIYKYISEAQINEVAEKQSPKFLNTQVSQGNTDVLNSVSAFLLSSETASIKIGLQMLAVGGVPVDILDLILMLAKASEDSSIRGEAKKILQIHAPSSWKLLIDDKQLFKNLNGQDAKEQDIYNKLKAIAVSAGIESAAILSLALFKRYKKGLRYMVLTDKVPDEYKKTFYGLIAENGCLDFATALGFKSWKGYAPEEMILNTYKIKYKLPIDVLQSHKITSMNLHNCKLTAVPKELVTFKDLRTLDMSCNNLTTLPAYVAQLQELEDLDLSSNNIEEFPMTLLKLKKLQKLNLQHNRKDNKIISITIPVEARGALAGCEILS